MIPSGALAPEFLERISRWRNGSGTFRMNVALSALPSFTALPGGGDHLTTGIILGPGLAYMDRAWQDARSHGWSREPVVELLIPSTLDDSLCPPGQHVASLFCQHVAPQLPDGRSWDDHRDEVADLMIATVDKYAPGFAASVIGRQILSPLDLERQFGLLGGDIFHGALTLNQLFSARPMLGHADYRGLGVSIMDPAPSRRRRHRPGSARKAIQAIIGAIWVKAVDRPVDRLWKTADSCLKRLCWPVRTHVCPVDDAVEVLR